MALDSGLTLSAPSTLTGATVSVAGFVNGDTLTINGNTSGTIDNGKITYDFAGPTMMLSGIPNFAFAVGYTNASWTLKADLTAQHISRLLAYMDKHGYTKVCPRRPADMREVPIIDFSSGYIQRALDRMPRQGENRPWRLYQNYALDTYELVHARVHDPALDLA